MSDLIPGGGRSDRGRLFTIRDFLKWFSVAADWPGNHDRDFLHLHLAHALQLHGSLYHVELVLRKYKKTA